MGTDIHIYNKFKLTVCIAKHLNNEIEGESNSNCIWIELKGKQKEMEQLKIEEVDKQNEEAQREEAQNKKSWGKRENET